MALRLFPDRRLYDRGLPESTSILTITLAFTVAPTINSFPEQSIDGYTYPQPLPRLSPVTPLES